VLSVHCRPRLRLLLVGKVQTLDPHKPFGLDASGRTGPLDRGEPAFFFSACCEDKGLRSSPSGRSGAQGTRFP